MPKPHRNLTRRLDDLARRVADRRAHASPAFERYRLEPEAFARDVLGVTLWDQTAAVLRGLVEPPYKVSVDSGHGVGKTFTAAVAVLWWYYTRPACWCITTAPTDRDVKDLLWTEIRLIHSRAKVALPHHFLPAAPEMRSGPEHVAKGYTARDANSAQGRHRPNMLFVFDEKEGVPAAFWDGMKSMLRPGSGDAALVIGNPLSTTSRAYLEHKAVDLGGEPSWRRVRLNSLDHPNIPAGLNGEPPPVPGAVTVGQVDMWVADWCDEVLAGDERPTDIRWRGKCYRPGPVGEPRILGLRPTAGTFGVWSESLWAACQTPAPLYPDDCPLPTIGCDVANFGDDYTCTHTQCHGVSLRHHAANGWDHLRIADHLRVETDWAAWWWNNRRPSGVKPVTPRQIPIHLEDDATGRAVQTVLRQPGSAGGYTLRPMNASTAPKRPDLYPSLRCEAWFFAAKLAARGALHVAGLDRRTLHRLEQQLLAPTWAPDLTGRRVVERKEVTKRTIGRSPDDADAFLLAHYDPCRDHAAIMAASKPLTGRATT